MERFSRFKKEFDKKAVVSVVLKIKMLSSENEEFFFTVRTLLVIKFKIVSNGEETPDLKSPNSVLEILYLSLPTCCVYTVPLHVSGLGPLKISI